MYDSSQQRGEMVYLKDQFHLGLPSHLELVFAEQETEHRRYYLSESHYTAQEAVDFVARSRLSLGQPWKALRLFQDSARYFGSQVHFAFLLETFLG